LHAGLLVEMEDVGVAHDVARARRADEDDVGHLFRDERLAERLPCLAMRRRILVGEVEDDDALLAMEARDLGGKLLRAAVAPLRPEAALSAVIAGVRTPARELDDDRALVSPIRVVAVIDELPADAIRIEVLDDGGRRRRD